jgi:hypothetical protein
MKTFNNLPRNEAVESLASINFAQGLILAKMKQKKRTFSIVAANSH